MASVILSNALRLPLRRPTPNPIVVSERHAALHALACTLWSHGVSPVASDASSSLLCRGMKTKTYMEHVVDYRVTLISGDATSSHWTSKTSMRRLSRARAAQICGRADGPGSGKGGQVRSCKTAAADGQAINKRSTNVSLIHKPTGIRVTCQDTRSLETNRLLARKRLVEQVRSMSIYVR